MGHHQQTEWIVVDNLDVEVARRGQDYIALTPRPDGTLLATTPAITAHKQIADLVQDHWETLRTGQSVRLNHMETPRYSAGEYHYLLGRPYELVFEEAPEHAIGVTDGVLLMSAPASTLYNDTAWTERRAMVAMWEQQELLAGLTQLIPYWQEQTGRAASTYTVSSRLDDWAHYDLRHDELSFNTSLVQKPLPCLHVVIAGGLLSSRYAPGSHDLFAAIADLYPNWAQGVRWLNMPPPYGLAADLDED